MVLLKVVDCRVCGDPHSVLRFAFVEFADERKLVIFGTKFLVGILKSIFIMYVIFTVQVNRWCKSSIKPWWDNARLLSS